MFLVSTGERSQENEISSQIRRKLRINRVMQVDHQKICKTDSGYNQKLVFIIWLYQSTKLAEAVPCQTAAAEETCDHLITHWISRYGCPMTFQSDNGKAFFWGPDKRSHEEIPHCTGTLDDIPSTNEWTRGEAEQNASEYAQGILLEVHDRLGQISAASGRGVQKHAAFNNGDRSLHGVDRQRQSDALDFLLSGI